MPRISFWNPQRSNDFNFIDRQVGEMMRISGDGVLVHEYTGPVTASGGSTNTSVNAVQDALFLTNSSISYNPDVYEMKCHHVPQDTTWSLTQFGMDLTSDMIRIQFHYNDMMGILGRKLIAGDVLEFPSMVDIPIYENASPINRYYVIQDSMWSAPGYGQTWFPHLWLVRAKLMPNSPEYSQIISQAASGQTLGGMGQGMGIVPEGFADTADSNGNPGTGPQTNIMNSLSTFSTLIGINAANVCEAQQNAFFDPKFFESENLWIEIDTNTGYPMVGGYFFTGSGMPPNGQPLLGAGVSFPENMKDGEYYLRVDYYPERLYQKQGPVLKMVQQDVLKIWTATNRVLDTFIFNNNTTTLPNGTVVPEKQATSQIMKQRVDLYTDRRTTILSDETTRKSIADTNAKTQKNIDPASGSPSGYTNPYD